MLNMIRSAATSLFHASADGSSISASGMGSQNTQPHGTTRESENSFDFLACRKALRDNFPDGGTFRDIRWLIRGERRMADKQVAMNEAASLELLDEMLKHDDIRRAVFLSSPFSQHERRYVLALTRNGEIEKVLFNGEPEDGDYVVLRRDRKKTS